MSLDSVRQSPVVSKMSILCERPDSEFFQTIPDLHDAVHSFAENEVLSKLESFGRLFVKHGVDEEFGLAMVHRHFDISNNEVLVETLNDQNSISVTSPWIIEGMYEIYVCRFSQSIPNELCADIR